MCGSSLEHDSSLYGGVSIIKCFKNIIATLSQRINFSSKLSIISGYIQCSFVRNKDLNEPGNFPQSLSGAKNNPSHSGSELFRGASLMLMKMSYIS